MTSDPPVFAGRIGRRVGGLFLIGVGAVVAFSCWDARRASKHEAFSEITAVGDRNYFGNPDPPMVPGKPVAQAENQLWVPVSFEKERRRDSQMIRAARDASGSLTLYRPRKDPKKDELFIKIARNGYLRLRPQ